MEYSETDLRIDATDALTVARSRAVRTDTDYIEAEIYGLWKELEDRGFKLSFPETDKRHTCIRLEKMGYRTMKIFHGSLLGFLQHREVREAMEELDSYITAQEGKK